MIDDLTIVGVKASALVVPTDRHESDGTFAWDDTTMVLVEVETKDSVGIGWTYANASVAPLVRGPLAGAIVGLPALWIAGAFAAMNRVVRNIGRPGLAWDAISAVDVALWDLKAKHLGVSLADLLGRVRPEVVAYASGGFTSYDDAVLEAQLGGWSDDGFDAVKVKVGRDPEDDRRRVELARRSVRRDVEIFVDANGAYARKEALALAESFAPLGVTWFEEPVSSDDTDGLRFLRDRVPAPIEIAAGEYGYLLRDFRELIERECLDVLQADATRCGGVTGMLSVAALCETFELPLSAHCAPHLHAHVGAALRPLRHVEYFHDHARLEQMVFEGALVPRGGRLVPDATKPGLGVRPRPDVIERYMVQTHPNERGAGDARERRHA